MTTRQLRHGRTFTYIVLPPTATPSRAAFATAFCSPCMQMQRSYPIPTDPPEMHRGHPAWIQSLNLEATPFTPVVSTVPFRAITAPTDLRLQLPSLLIRSASSISTGSNSFL